ncbi:hypothetical protein [uncultured Parasutterella sp.]|uniref:hypothetical protein n=1 Tax=uncultured Parasutterella sp. TaxID=1263098 RepID=UPI002608ED68|nr:hypothetical protein [uncultured Parasutterella sp.]
MKISYKPRLSGLCSIYGAKHREIHSNCDKNNNIKKNKKRVSEITETKICRIFNPTGHIFGEK